jgi:hypothetical protein
MIGCHFTAHFFFMKCACVVSGHCAQIELSLYLSLLLLGSILLFRVAELELELELEPELEPEMDTIFVPVVLSLVPVHLERSSFLPTRSQILLHSKH